MLAQDAFNINLSNRKIKLCIYFSTFLNEDATAGGAKEPIIADGGAPVNESRWKLQDIKKLADSLMSQEIR